MKNEVQTNGLNTAHHILEDTDEEEVERKYVAKCRPAYVEHIGQQCCVDYAEEVACDYGEKSYYEQSCCQCLQD